MKSHDLKYDKVLFYISILAAIKRSEKLNNILSYKCATQLKFSNISVADFLKNNSGKILFHIDVTFVYANLTRQSIAASAER
jgi:hypothetical protein